MNVKMDDQATERFEEYLPGYEQIETAKKPKRSHTTGKALANIPASHFHTLDLNVPKSKAVILAEKKKTMEVRRIGACHRCRILHKTVSLSQEFWVEKLVR